MARSAEERALDRLREALPAPYRLYPNVRWIANADAHSPARDGETDLLIVHAERGLLIVETKGGRIRRDGQNRWRSGEHELKPPLESAITGLPLAVDPADLNLARSPCRGSDPRKSRHALG